MCQCSNVPMCQLKKGNWFIVLLFSLVIISCKKEDKKYSVLYKIAVYGTTAGYTVRYTLPNGNTKSQGPLTAQSWNSTTLEGYPKSTPVRFELESGGGSYHMSILINGALDSERDAGGGGTQSLETHTPN